MTLTLNEEQILRKQIEIQKLEYQLQNAISTQPVLIPTKDAEISTLKQQIKAEEIHVTRAEYVKKVQPMKDNHRMLITQNKQIKIDNQASIDAVRSVDELVRQEIFNSINIIKNELSLLLKV